LKCKALLKGGALAYLPVILRRKTCLSGALYLPISIKTKNVNIATINCKYAINKLSIYKNVI
jgi:hypothetical protein